MNVNKIDATKHFGATPLEVDKGGDNTSRGVLKSKACEGILLMRYMLE